MTIKEWFFERGEFYNPPISGQWKLLHILTLLICITLIIIFNFITKKSKRKNMTKNIIISILCYSILFFEIVVRIKNILNLQFYKDVTLINLVHTLLPRPWCAISCWSLIASLFIKKKFFYNYASLSALLCSVIFFIYPGVGFNNEYIMFSNLYSIITHALLLITSITLMKLKYTEFKLDNLWKVMICFILTFAYGILQIYILKIHSDPMYFMPEGDIQKDILGISWGLYISCYIIVFLIYIFSFYIANEKDKIKFLLLVKRNSKI